MTSEAESEIPVSRHRGLRSRRAKWIAAALSISAAVILSATVYIFFYEAERGPMTMTQLVDKMIDVDGDGIPDQYVPYDEGDNVTVRDRLIGYEYSDFGAGVLHTLKFSYTGEKWRDTYGLIGYVWASIWGNASICSYGVGDWITLAGTVEEYEWDNTTTELINWSVVGEPDPFEIPSLELNLTRVSNSTWRIEISDCNMDCKFWHFEFLLKRYGFGWDLMEPPEHGKRSTYMEFWDIDRNGCLSEGDLLYVTPEEEGDYEVMVSFQSVELADVSWHQS
ncbi:MAG: hypothetical protein V3V98_05535 [Thermoplasmata archaeon]